MKKFTLLAFLVFIAAPQWCKANHWDVIHNCATSQNGDSGCNTIDNPSVCKNYGGPDGSSACYPNGYGQCGCMN